MKLKFPWAPVGASTFNRVQGMGYTPGGLKARLTGRGSAAGVFKTGPFRRFSR